MLNAANIGLAMLALALSAVFTPAVIRLCSRLRAFDAPCARKVHRREVPRLGGVGLFIALSLGMTAAGFAALAGWIEIPAQYVRLMPVIYLGLCGYFFIGFWDDLRSLPAWPRLIAQLAVASMVVLLGWGAGLRITAAFGHYVFPAWLSFIVSVVWIAGVVNCFNWIDGLDGLAAGLGLIAALAFFALVVLKPGLPNTALTAALCALIIGALLGFLPYNFYPARTFIGDGGAFSLGYMLAVVSVVGLFKTAAVISFLLPVLILALPIGDTLFAILRRLARGEPVTAPDNQHIHHRILALFSRRYRRALALGPRSSEAMLAEARAHRNTVLALYAFAALFAALAVGMGIRA